MRTALSFGVLFGVMACGGAAPPPSQGATNVSSSEGAKPAASAEPAPAEYRAIENAPDRDPDDKKLDAGRKPAQFLAFVGVRPRNHVAELAAGGGYTTELLARAVGPMGVVYGQNSPWMLERFAKKPWEARVAKPVNKNVVSVAREFEDPLPPEAKDLDAVVINLVYHDTVGMNVDRAKMNAAVLKALKPGGHGRHGSEDAPSNRGVARPQRDREGGIQACCGRIVSARSFRHARLERVTDGGRREARSQ